MQNIKPPKPFKCGTTVQNIGCSKFVATKEGTNIALTSLSKKATKPQQQYENVNCRGI